MDKKRVLNGRRLIAVAIGAWGAACLVFAVLNATHAIGFMSQHWLGEWSVFGRLPKGDDFGVQALLAAIGCLLMGLLWLWSARLLWHVAWRPATFLAMAAILTTLAIGYGLR